MYDLPLPEPTLALNIHLALLLCVIGSSLFLLVLDLTSRALFPGDFLSCTISVTFIFITDSLKDPVTLKLNFQMLTLCLPCRILRPLFKILTLPSVAGVFNLIFFFLSRELNIRVTNKKICLKYLTPMLNP